MAAASEPLAPATAAGTHMAGIVFRQLFDPVSSTYTYLLGDVATGEAVLIDPVLERADRDVALARELGLRLIIALNTHVHADHVSGTKALKGKVAGLRSAIAAVAGAEADLQLHDGDRVAFGGRHLLAMSTPGHTPGCMTYVLDDHSACFSGDALFVRGCGRTDFQGGSSDMLYESIHRRIFALPGATVIYPGHDYNGHMRTTVAEEMRFNPRLTKTKPEFIALMAALGLPRPKLIDLAVPANLRDGEVPAPAPPPAAAAGDAKVVIAATAGGGAV